MPDGIRLFPDWTFTPCLAQGLNSHLSIVVHRHDGAVYFDGSDFGGQLHVRCMDTVGYLRHLHAIASADNHNAALNAPSFVFQTDDNPVDTTSVSWERKFGWNSVRLIPDIYYFQAGGYEDFLPQVPDWDSRPDKLIWRGATTGILGLTIENLDRLPRYRLASIASTLGDGVDVGINNIVQATTSEQYHAVHQRLEAEGLLRPFVPLEEMRYARYVVDIDGNANSWNFIQRLRLGACMLRVESVWEQWFASRLRAWEHYVPISTDLSNFAERFDWCRSNPLEAARIASAGRQFALDMRFKGEMLTAARTTFPAPRV